MSREFTGKTSEHRNIHGEFSNYLINSFRFREIFVKEIQ